VYIQPDGGVINCAISKEVLGNVNSNTLDNILSGPSNQNIKKDMSGDIFHHRCSQCYFLENDQKNSFDQVSNRVWYLKTMSNTDLKLFDKPENYQLKMLDLRWKNTCNFACVYCGPDYSSMWANELNQPQYLDATALEDSLNYIHKNLDSVDHIYLAGGEPLLIKENIDLLSKLQTVNPNIEIRINTNLSVINNTVYNLLKKFKNVHWTVSIDSIEEEFEYTRYGGSWKTFVKNLHQLNNDFEKINFNAVWFVLNGKSIVKSFDFLQGLGYHENTFIVNPLDHPLFWCVGNLPDEMIVEIREEIKNRLKIANPQYSLYNSLNLMLQYTYRSFDKNLNSTFKELSIIDNRRKLDSSKIFTELYKFKEGN
jgi:sulfatase maturation enzyme AslB (radical SAM superfamily)